MRRAPRFKDANHPTLRDDWRKLGGSWLDIVPLEGGEPDALVGWRGVDQLIEIKRPDGTAGQRRLRANQVEWHRAWRGRPVARVETLADIVRLFP
jgi:hypothetical protein